MQSLTFSGIMKVIWMTCRFGSVHRYFFNNEKRNYYKELNWVMYSKNCDVIKCISSVKAFATLPENRCDPNFHANMANI